MPSLHLLKAYAAEYNRCGMERQHATCAKAGAVLRAIGMSPSELGVYQDRIAGIERRFAVLLSRMRKPPTLFR